MTDCVNNKQELHPAVKSVTPEVREMGDVYADTGYFREAAVEKLENDEQGVTVYCAIEKQDSHRNVDYLMKKPIQNLLLMTR